MLLSMKRISQNSMFNIPLIYMHICHLNSVLACACAQMHREMVERILGFAKGVPCVFLYVLYYLNF